MQPVEKRIITALIKSADAAGFVPVKFWDSEEYQDITWKNDSTGPSLLAQRIASSLACVDSVDDGTLHFAPKTDLKEWGSLGVYLVLGNGVDVISDWHCGNTAFDAAVDAVAMKAEDYA